RITPDSDLPPPHAAEAPATHPPPPHAPPLVATSLVLGMRARGPADDVAFAGGAAITWRPDEIGLVASGSFSAASDVMAGAFSGAIRDDAFAIAAQVPIIPRARWWLLASAGAALHVVSLRGALAT